MKDIPILYQDEEIIVINKRAGLCVQGGAGVSSSVDSILPKQIGAPVFLVHRLDKETAGILIVAKTPNAANKWTRLISSHKVKKEYVALCLGKPEKSSGTIDEEISTKGVSKKARTYYKVLSEYTTESGQTFSLVSLILDTGRMHQIRIHLARLGCPIAGDDKYGNFKLNKSIKKEFAIKSLQLAAIKLTVPINGTQKIFEISNPICAINSHI